MNFKFLRIFIKIICNIMEKNFFSTITKIAENLELKYYWVVFLKYIKPIFFISLDPFRSLPTLTSSG